MMQRSKPVAIRLSYAALTAGRFAEARALAAPWTTDPAARLLHALAAAATGEVEGPADTLAAIARANPTARHPALDLADLIGNRAIPHLRAATARAPGDPALLARLGQCLAETGPIEDAIAAFRRTTTLRPNDPATWSNLGKSLAAAARFAEAEPAFLRATTLAPANPQLTLNHAVARLKSGDLPAGWPLFRARHRLPGHAPPPPGPELTDLAQLPGQTILLVHDEGYGDTLQFIRYAPLLTASGARVLVAAPPPLARLLASNGLTLAEAPYDRWCRIPDLPALFATTTETIPATIPYLHADPALVEHWRTRLPPSLPGHRRIGLVWAGAPRRHDPAAAATDRLRSIPPTLLTPLLQTPGVTWISLQHGQSPPPGLFDPMPQVRDFADTAAILANLDQLVTVDTAPAHLAAAMGRPVLLLDRYDNCWRWLTGREDSPWYPGTIRILRQQTPGDWPGVLRRAASRITHPPPAATASPSAPPPDTATTALRSS